MNATAVNPDDYLDLATFHRRNQADSLRVALSASGIPSQIKDEKNLQRFWFMAPAKASFHVQVERKHFDEAEKMLKTEGTSGADEAIHCPSCHSTRVQYPALTRKNILPGFVGWLLTVLHLQEHKYYCETCQYTWPQPKPDSKPRDILQW